MHAKVALAHSLSPPLSQTTTHPLVPFHFTERRRHAPPTRYRLSLVTMFRRTSFSNSTYECATVQRLYRCERPISRSLRFTLRILVNDIDRLMFSCRSRNWSFNSPCNGWRKKQQQQQQTNHNNNHNNNEISQYSNTNTHIPTHTYITHTHTHTPNRP
jgi:hypothetical protein